MKYSFADLTVEIKNRYDFVQLQCADYECETIAPADISVCVTDDDIRRERLVSEGDYSDGYLESVCTYRNLCNQLPMFDAMLLHASVVDVDLRGVAFLALSGTGKSTHTFLWQNHLGDKLTIVNGDKPIIRFFDGVPYAYGTPWNGKEGLSTKMRTRLTDLCFIERSETNSVEQLSESECSGRIMNQILLPRDAECAIKTLEMADRLLSGCNKWLIKCNTKPEAAEVAIKTILKV